MSSKCEAVWSVVAVAKEPPDVIQRFVAWHLHAGAALVTIFFDDPDDPCIDMVAHIEKVRAVRCTPEFWEALGITQETRFTKRQNWACHSGYESSPDGWVLVIDADELLYTRDRSPGAILAEFSDDVRSVLVLPAERVLLEGNENRGVFRQRMEPAQVSKVFGAFAPVLSRNHGLVGHSIGKSFLRTGLKNIWMKQHGITAPHPGRDLIVDRVIGQPEGAYRCIISVVVMMIGGENWSIDCITSGFARA